MLSICCSSWCRFGDNFEKIILHFLSSFPLFHAVQSTSPFTALHKIIFSITRTPFTHPFATDVWSCMRCNNCLHTPGDHQAHTHTFTAPVWSTSQINSQKPSSTHIPPMLPSKHISSTLIHISGATLHARTGNVQSKVVAQIIHVHQHAHTHTHTHTWLVMQIFFRFRSNKISSTDMNSYTMSIDHAPACVCWNSTKCSHVESEPPKWWSQCLAECTFSPFEYLRHYRVPPEFEAAMFSSRKFIHRSQAACWRDPIHVT